MTRTDIKSPLKKLIRGILNEITIAPSSVSRSYPEPREFLEKIKKTLKSVCDDKAQADFNEKNGRIVLSDCNGGDKFTVKVEKESDGIYKITTILNGSEREVKINQTEDNVIDYIKNDIKKHIEEQSYVEKAYDKNAIPEKKESESDKKPTDEYEEVKSTKKQIDHKPVEAKDRKDEELTKGTDGMEVSKDFVRQIDADSTEKVKLKADKKDASDEDVVQKLDSTPKLKKQDVKESMESIYKKKLSEIYEDSHSFITTVPVKINEGVKNIEVEVEYVLSKLNEGVKIVAITARKDGYGVSAGQSINESDIVHTKK